MKNELIPGLPDCVALDCLLRLPFHAISDARAVCKRWKYELDSPSFYRIRKAAGFTHRIVSLLLLGKRPSTVGKLHLLLYEPDTGVFTMRRLAPNRPNANHGSVDATVVGRELVVIGGWDALENRRAGEVHIYDLITGAWRPGAPIPARVRPLCRYGVKGGKVFVVGGRDEEGKRLRSALAYDVASDTWLELPDLGHDGTSKDDGSFCNEFWRSREEYDSAIRYCRKLFSLDDEDVRLFLYTPVEQKETVVSAPKEESEDNRVRVSITILSEAVLNTLRQRLGLMPYEIVSYLESFNSSRL